MQGSFKVVIILIRTNQQIQVELDPSASFRDLFEHLQEMSKIPIIQPFFEIVNLNNKVITDLNKQFGGLGLEIGIQIQINVYDKAEYDQLEEKRKQQLDKSQEKNFQTTVGIDSFLPPDITQTQAQVVDNRINLIFEIIDGTNKSTQIIKIDQNKSMNDAKEILLQQLGIIGQQREAVDIILSKPDTKVEFNPTKLGIIMTKQIAGLDIQEAIIDVFKYKRIPYILKNFTIGIIELNYTRSFPISSYENYIQLYFIFQMSIDYNVLLKIIQINRQDKLQIDPSVTFYDLLELANSYTTYPIDNPIFVIVNLNNKPIADLNMAIGQIGLNRDAQIQILICSEYEYKTLYGQEQQQQQNFQETANIDQFLPPDSQPIAQVQVKENRINLIFEVNDGNNTIVQNIKMDKDYTLYDAKEQLLIQCGIINQKRMAVDIDLYYCTSKGQEIFNPSKYKMKLSQLQFEDNQKIIGKFRYIGGQ